MKNNWKENNKTLSLTHGNHKFVIEATNDGTNLWKLSILKSNQEETIIFPDKEKAITFAEECLDTPKLKYLIMGFWATLLVSLVVQFKLASIAYIVIAYIVVLWLLLTGKLESERSYKEGRIIDCFVLWLFSPLVILFLSWHFRK